MQFDFFVILLLNTLNIFALSIKWEKFLVKLWGGGGGGGYSMTYPPTTPSNFLLRYRAVKIFWVNTKNLMNILWSQNGVVVEVCHAITTPTTTPKFDKKIF